MRLDGFGLLVNDMGKMIRFYRDVLGFEIREAEDTENVYLVKDGTLFLLYGRDDFEKMTHREYEYVKGINGHFELALYVDGLLFTGCAHSGLENILSACPYPVKTVIGGFHLLDNHEEEEELTALAQRLTAGYPETQFYTSHCTGDKVFATLKAVMGGRLQAFCCGTQKDIS